MRSERMESGSCAVTNEKGVSTPTQVFSLAVLTAIISSHALERFDCQ